MHSARIYQYTLYSAVLINNKIFHQHSARIYQYILYSTVLINSFITI